MTPQGEGGGLDAPFRFGTARETLESAGLQDTYWGRTIIDAEEMDDPEFDDDAVRASRSWVFCACGRLDDAIPRDASGAPLDHLLHGLGAQFPEFIWNHDPLGAARTLCLIEKRAAKVLAGLLPVKDEGGQG